MNLLDLRLYPERELRITASCSFTPLEPVYAQNLPDYGAPLILRDTSNFVIRGVNNPVITFNAHGNGIALQDCSDIIFDGITFVGHGILSDPKLYYFAGILHAGTTRRIGYRNCRFYDIGNHAIGHLYGPRDVAYCWVEDCEFARGGHINQPLLYMDGACIAWGGHHNRIRRCRFSEWVTFVEWEPGEGQYLPTNYNSCVDFMMERPFREAFLITPNNGRADLFEGNLVASGSIQGWGKTPIPYGGHSANGHDGFHITGSNGLRVSNIQMADFFQGCGVRIDPVHAPVQDCQFDGLNIRRTDKTGIHLVQTVVGPDGKPTMGFAVRRNQVLNNRIDQPGGRGIWVHGQDNQINNNLVSNTVWEGFYDDSEESGGNHWGKDNRTVNCGKPDQI